MAQRNEALMPEIKSLRVENLSQQWGLPIINLNSSDQLLISFDHLADEYQRFVYKIEHLTADFEASADLFESDFVENTAETEPIDSYAESMNTVTRYVHYELVFPNRKMRPLLSGNYRLIISLDEDDGLKPAAYVYFAVLDNRAATGLSVTTNTDIDWNKEHQQVELRVNTSNLEVRDAEREVRVVVMQNRRWDNAAIAPSPTYVTLNDMQWRHSPALIFEAGNEYRSFEMISTQYAGMGMERIRWHDPFYHATIFPDERRPNYLYNQDINGRYVVRTDDNTDAASESEYIWTHFTLNCEKIEGAHIFLNGDFTNDNLTPPFLMHYNAENECYEGTAYLKTGYYNYQYIAVPYGSTRGKTLPIEGNHYQTENEYDALVYYKRTGNRYWQLVGQAHYDYKPIN